MLSISISPSQVRFRSCEDSCLVNVGMGDEWLETVCEQTWDEGCYIARHLPKPLATVFRDHPEALKKQLATIRRDARRRTPSKYGPGKRPPPPGYTLEHKLAAPGEPVAIYDGKTWRTGIYLDQLGDRLAKKSTEKLPWIKLVAVIRPKAAGKKKPPAPQSESPVPDSETASETPVAPKLQLLVSQYSDCFATAVRASATTPANQS
jgi:hypothetical protein